MNELFTRATGQDVELWDKTHEQPDLTLPTGGRAGRVRRLPWRGMDALTVFAATGKYGPVIGL